MEMLGCILNESQRGCGLGSQSLEYDRSVVLEGFTWGQVSRLCFMPSADGSWLVQDRSGFGRDALHVHEGQ